MVTDERQQAINQLLRAWDAGQEDVAEEALLHLVRMLWGTDKPLLTTTEAAGVLGIRSVNTLKVLLRAENVSTVKHGNRTMIPFSALARLQNSERVQRLQAIDRMHDKTAALGSDDGMTDEQLEALEAGRPGTVPWKVKRQLAP